MAACVPEAETVGRDGVSDDGYGPGIGGLICGQCGWAPPTHSPGCPRFEGSVNTAWDREHARVAAEAHAQLRTQFALAVVRSGMSLSMDIEGGPVPSRPMNTMEWAHAVYNVADALAAESVRRRKAEGL